jgi:hypothetical protein
MDLGYHQFESFQTFNSAVVRGFECSNPSHNATHLGQVTRVQATIDDRFVVECSVEELQKPRLRWLKIDVLRQRYGQSC